MHRPRRALRPALLRGPSSGAPVVIFRCLAHTRRAEEGQHMAAKKSRKRRSGMRRSPVQKPSKALPGRKEKRSHDPHAHPDRDACAARTRSIENGGDRLREPVGPRQPDRVSGSVAPTPTEPLPGHRDGVRRRSAARRLPVAVLLPGLAFVATGRPVPGLTCYALQARLVGWLPAALWAAYATRQGKRKQRSLVARLWPS